MRNVFISVAFSAFLAGCASTQTGRVTTAPDGTPVYGLSPQPETALAGERPLMPGSSSGHMMETGQFTGQERTHDLIGQGAIPPASDAREWARTSKPPTGATGKGAGTLGQSGIFPDQNITSGTLMGSNLYPPTANPPSLATAPTLSQPLTGETAKRGAVGSAPGPESGGANSLTNNISLRTIPRADEPLRTAPLTRDAMARNSAIEDLPSRVRDVLTTGRPETITRLTPERVQQFDIEAANGNVTLRGDVRSETEKLMIGNKVAQMQGVRSVNNQLRVIRPGTDSMDKPLGSQPPTVLER
jgi:hypothetical protein